MWLSGSNIITFAFESVLNGFLHKKNLDVYVIGSKEEAFYDYSVYGGLPAVDFMVTEEQKVTYLTTQMNNLYLRDIIIDIIYMRIVQLENIVLNKLRYRGYKVDVGVVESRERDETGKEIRKQLEIDFIATIGSKNIISNQLMQFPMRRNTNKKSNPLTKQMILSRFGLLVLRGVLQTKQERNRIKQ